MSDTAISLAADTVRRHGFGGPYDAAIVTGTGLGLVAGKLEDSISLAYSGIPGFPSPGVTGHGGTLHAGRLSGRRVLVFEGRSHAYETGNAAVMKVPLGVAKALGVPLLLLTNAAGSLMAQAGPGSLVAVADHINLSGLNPLIGETGDGRFVPLVGAYDSAARETLHEAARECGIPLHHGVYAWFSGPSFETPAEIRMAGRLGADLVGMSTVPEVILARFFGLRVAAISVVTNLAAGIGDGDPHHDETKRAAAAAAFDLARLIDAFVARL
ncbi:MULTISPECIES: purine-nucleoside phosphorylase [unclassified Methylobacterium]|jgi:purine-nucleoside phosphorylase|uniref:purine-nucleoside phosphorylase n=1 Tax=unclassified Methylobacterium TaxID=2615210 RepID=UPI0006FA4B46|nr:MULTISPECIES: purine-nucleoside phosphorylase [unclassified Methylobacterium]KQO55185.1 purine nucleoside phosphorylase [Methylobacterium sp. Leaf86]KQO91019.1 purine nucleoside phosphorylase [Methylobacterium sp. Leaf91]